LKKEFDYHEKEPKKLPLRLVEVELYFVKKGSPSSGSLLIHLSDFVFVFIFVG